MGMYCTIVMLAKDEITSLFEGGDEAIEELFASFEEDEDNEDAPILDLGKDWDVFGYGLSGTLERKRDMPLSFLNDAGDHYEGGGFDLVDPEGVVPLAAALSKLERETLVVHLSRAPRSELYQGESMPTESDGEDWNDFLDSMWELVGELRELLSGAGDRHMVVRVA